VVVSVCDDPPIDRRYWATKGRGAFRADAAEKPIRLKVTRARALAGARSFVPPPEWVRGDEAHAMAVALAKATRPTEAEDHPALQVAFGGYEVAVFFMAGPWDLAAPALVVEEAGGRFTDLNGATTLSAGAVFSNGALHDATIDCLRAARER
jgi:histidinol-phosphatase